MNNAYVTSMFFQFLNDENIPVAQYRILLRHLASYQLSYWHLLYDCTFFIFLYQIHFYIEYPKAFDTISSIVLFPFCKETLSFWNANDGYPTGNFRVLTQYFVKTGFKILSWNCDSEENILGGGGVIYME